MSKQNHGATIIRPDFGKKRASKKSLDKTEAPLSDKEILDELAGVMDNLMEMAMEDMLLAAKGACRGLRYMQDDISTSAETELSLFAHRAAQQILSLKLEEIKKKLQDLEKEKT